MQRHSPLQNRVTPFGEVIATPERGAFMGNRGGRFHDAEQQLLTRRWVNTHWITCLLEFKGWHREVMQPGRYTELFFLDEATAYAAGHRPCFECRRSDALRFEAAWRAANPGLASGPGIGAVDAVLHRERTTRDRRKVTFMSPIGILPSGGLFVDPASGDACLRWSGRNLVWSPGGYSAGHDLAPGSEVVVLTPRSVVAAFAAGLVPAVHESAS
jgi:hypothetical protein